MADRTVRVTLRAEVGAFIAGMDKAGAKVDEVAAKEKRSAADRQKAWADGSTALMGFGAAALGGVALAANSFAKFDAQMSAVKATGADARANIDDLTQAAMDAGRVFGQFDATEAAQGVEQLAKAGLSAQQILSGGLNGALTLAAAGEMSVGEAAEVTAKTLKQFNLAGADAGRVADLLAAGAGKAVGDVSDLAQALAQAGLVANQYGVSVEDTVATLSMFADNALLGSDAGTSLKSMLLQLASPTKEAQATLDSLGISAYDAQGRFVGMESLAGQLQDRLKGLSQEQQNAALKTIFGNDAIRAANVLMKEGASGVREYRDAVSEQGYAAQVAATKMDNLQGDLKALGGSWETLTIRMGQGANSPLRSAVQDITGMVDALGNMPPAAQAFALGGTAIVGGAALIAGGLMKATTAAVDMHANYKVLTSEMPKTAAAMRGAAVAAGLLFAAFAAAKAIDMKVDASRAVQGLSQTTAAMLEVGTAKKNLDSQLRATDALDRFFQTKDGGQLVKGVDDISGAFRRLNPEMKTSGEQFNDFMSRAIRGVPGGNAIGSSVSQLEGQFGEMDKTLAHMSSSGAGEAAAKSFARIRQEAEASGFPLERLTQLMPEYHAQLQQQANALGITGLSAQDYVNWMSGKIPDAVKAAGAAAQAAGQDMSGLPDVLDKTSESAGEAAFKVRELISAMLQVSGSELSIFDSIDKLNKALQENGTTLDKTSEKGRENRRALMDLASSHLSYIDSLEKSGASAEKVASAQEQMRVAMDGAIGKFGLSTAAAEQLRRELGLTSLDTQALKAAYDALPGAKETKVSAPGAKPSKAEVDAFMKTVQNVPAEKRTAIRTIAELSGVRAARAALASLQNRTVTVTTVYINKVTGARQTGAKGNNIAVADGGIIDFYAAGGIRENHIAQIAPAGAWRVWAEDETGGEAYIPLAMSKRRRSMDILAEVARIFGHQLIPNAMGSIMPSIPPAPAYSGSSGGGFTFAPQITASGLDPRQVIDESMTRMTHELRANAIPLIGAMP